MTFTSKPVLLALLVALIGSNLFWVIRQKNSRLYYADGIEKIHKKNFSGAISAFEKALWQNPDDASAHFGMGWAYQLRGQNPKSVEHYVRSIAISENLLGFSLNNLQFIEQHRTNAVIADKLNKKKDLLTQLRAIQ